MEAKYILYYILLFIAFLLSLLRTKQDKRIWLFSIMLFLSLCEELFFEWLLFKNKADKYYFVYHFFVPVYYSFFCGYFYLISQTVLTKRIIISSIPVFFVTSIFISFSQKNINVFPGIQINIAGFFLIVNSLIALFQMDAKDKSLIYVRPIFWVSISTLIFYSGLFVLNGAYNYLLETKSALAINLHDIINLNLNYLYYLLIIIGMICSKQTMKFS